MKVWQFVLWLCLIVSMRYGNLSWYFEYQPCPDPPKFEGGPDYPGQVPDHPSFKGLSGSWPSWTGSWQPWVA